MNYNVKKQNIHVCMLISPARGLNKFKLPEHAGQSRKTNGGRGLPQISRKAQKNKFVEAQGSADTHVLPETCIYKTNRGRKSPADLAENAEKQKTLVINLDDAD